MRGQLMGRLGVVAVVLTLLAGCGVNLEISGQRNVVPGQTASFTVNMTNISVCPLVDLGLPLGIDFELAAFVPRAQLGDSFFADLCGINGPDRLPASDHGLATAGAPEIAAARAELAVMAAQAAAVQCSGTGATCISEDNIAACDTGGTFAPNEVRTLTCAATVPTGIGRRYTLAASAQVASGVCVAGSSAPGAACLGDNDCGGVSGSCGDGICVGGANTGNGCDPTGSDCPGGTCTDCLASAGLGIACFASDIGAAPAPALAPWGAGVALLGLALIAFWRLRGRGI